MKVKEKQISASFVGKYELTVLSDSRVILPIDVIRQLRSQNIEKLLPGRLPGLKALLLCPEIFWCRWRQTLTRRFPCLKSDNGTRTFFVPWQPIRWDSKGRISLPREAREFAGIKPYQTVIILGNNYCFELWAQERLDEVTRECEDILQRSTQS
jgi:DNA-binding transcriptional regulator/RsmH inhibitor MraZ